MHAAIGPRLGSVFTFLLATVAVGWFYQSGRTPAAEKYVATPTALSASYFVGFLPPNYPNTPPPRDRPPSGGNETRPPRPPPVVPPNPPPNPPPPPRDDDTPSGGVDTPPQPPQAPEPTTLISAIVGTGMVGVYSWYRRKRKACCTTPV